MTGAAAGREQKSLRAGDAAVAAFVAKAKRDVVLERLPPVLAAFARVDSGAVLDVCAAVVDEHGAGVPFPSLVAEGLRADARFWADAASPLELQAYVAAAFEALGARANVVAPAGAKRLLVALWGRLTDEERRAFLSRVDPRGRFRP